MYLSLVVLVAIIAVLLILIVLVQNSKGGGLSSEFSGGGGQMFGVKKTTDLLEQITWGMAGAIMFISLASYVIVGNGTQTSQTINSVNVEKAQNSTLPGGSIAPPSTSTAPGAAAPGAIAPGDTN